MLFFPNNFMLLWAMSDLSAPSCSELHQSSQKQEVPWHCGTSFQGEERQGTIFNWQTETDQQLSGCVAAEEVGCSTCTNRPAFPGSMAMARPTWGTKTGPTSWRASFTCDSLWALVSRSRALGLRISYFTVLLWGHLCSWMERFKTQNHSVDR